jgi:hypothetical protein
MLKPFFNQRSYRTENQAVAHSVTQTFEEHYICMYGDYPTSTADIPQVVSFLPFCCHQFMGTSRSFCANYITELRCVRWKRWWWGGARQRGRYEARGSVPPPQSAKWLQNSETRAKNSKILYLHVFYSSQLLMVSHSANIESIITCTGGSETSLKYYKLHRLRPKRSSLAVKGFKPGCAVKVIYGWWSAVK